ncbi:MAG TPA: SRPBCC family protein [Micromonosporaceae bacterium]|nr:SRPBCC family protein [Micromonosporaceae bacterium]
MILVERTGRVAASVEGVWEVIRRAERLPEWLAGVQRVEVLSGEGFGRQQRILAADGSLLDAEVIAYRAPTLIAWRERSAGMGARAEARTEMHVELSSDGDGTTVRLIVVRWAPGPVSAALLRLGTRRVGSSLEGSLERLAELAAPRPVVESEQISS